MNGNGGVESEEEDDSCGHDYNNIIDDADDAAAALYPYDDLEDLSPIGGPDIVAPQSSRFDAAASAAADDEGRPPPKPMLTAAAAANLRLLEKETINMENVTLPWCS